MVANRVASIHTYLDSVFWFESQEATMSVHGVDVETGLLTSHVYIPRNKANSIVVARFSWPLSYCSQSRSGEEAGGCWKLP